MIVNSCRLPVDGTAQMAYQLHIAEFTYSYYFTSLLGTVASRRMEAGAG